MRSLILAATLIAPLVLASCAQAPVQLASTPQRDTGVIAVATLAPLGSFEWQVAPDYTRLAVTRRLAARLLAQGRISVEVAEQVQVEADAARRLLDAAVAVGSGAANVAQAREHIARAQKLVEVPR